MQSGKVRGGETGYRTGPGGALVPRDIIQRFVCTYNGEEVFSADFFPAIAANPFIALRSTAEIRLLVLLSILLDNRRDARSSGSR